MRVLIRLSDNLCVIADESLRFTTRGCEGNEWINAFFTPDKYAIQDADLPYPYADGAYSYLNGVWTVVDKAPLVPVIKALMRKGADLIQGRLNQTARSYGYDDVKSAKGYFNSPSAAYAAEGAAFLAWETACWQYAQALETGILAGTTALPTEAQLVAGLPVLNLPPPSLPI